jgi:predicted nuclease of predicted toxin-antitoxin system
VRLLADSCVSSRVAEQLVALAHDVEWVGSWPADPGDEEVLRHAYRTDRILITLDKGFGERAILRGESHSGIIRLLDIATANQTASCHDVLVRHEAELLGGAIVVISPGRVRIRTPEAT